MGSKQQPSQNNRQVSPGVLLDYPVEPWFEYSGYIHKKDQTLVPNNKLTFPSVNVIMPDGDKIVPRGGELLIPQDNAIQNSNILGRLKKYKNIAGIEMEIRVWNDNTMTLTGIVGIFVVGETITGATSGATATVNSITGSVITFENLIGTFSGLDVVTGGTSGAFGVMLIYKGDVIEVLYQGNFVQITPNVNPLAKGLSAIGSNRIYYFDQWIDTNLDSALSINTNRAVWVMGLSKIRSWTGGIASIVSIVPNVSITTTTGITWSSLGFPSPTNGGSPNIVVNGVTYTVASGWNTDTLQITNTTGISAGNTAFAGIQEQTAPVRFDYMSGFKNYLNYGNWDLQKYYIANNFNRYATQEITNVQAVQNDLVLDNSNYTGIGSHVYRVTIDSVNPEVNTQTFTGGGLNDAVWNTSAYSAGPQPAPNVYNINIVGDVSISIALTLGWTIGEVIQGGTSQAEGIVVAAVGIFGGTVLGIRMLTVNTFQSGETITGLSSGTTATVGNPVFQNWFSGNKNGTIFNTGGIYGSIPVNAIFSSGPIILPDGLIITFSNFDGHFIGDSFQLTINLGTNDTFQWQIDGAIPVATHVPITGASQILSNGISITFVNKTGHTLGDFWEITVNQQITGAWYNFYYPLPRGPGYGYIGQLPANFWTMFPQEDQMYLNDASGNWGTIETKLSTDLQTETIEYTPLKQKGRNKVIYPYMIGYRDNHICYVTEDKNLDMIGREPLLQLPQISHLSDDVKLDFLAASFNNGSIEWVGLRLYITSPEDMLMFVYDESMEYWQPPCLIPENGILSIIGNNLVSHSSLRNVTNTLFVGTNDNGNPFTIKIRTGYNYYGNRWAEDVASMVFVEGYMQGNPQLSALVFQDVNGCHGIQRGVVDPVYCIASDRAPFGYGSLGSHSHGNDTDSPIPYFQWIGVGQKSFAFYMAAMELQCESLDPVFEILLMALNTVASENNNSKLKKGQVKLI